MKRILILVLLVLVPLSSALAEYQRGRNGMVSSRSDIASEVGREILQQGGNAMDAAVAVGFALAVVYPSAGNIGGGGFMIYKEAGGDVYAQDSRERAPLAAGRDMFLDDEGNVDRRLALNSLQASGTPGTVAGLLDALERFGTMSRQAVMAGAIELAADGFTLNNDLADQFSDTLDAFRQYTASLEKFTRDDGEPYQAGDTFVQGDLAETLTLISENGRAGFYEGKVADLIVAEMERNNGLITHEDLANYEAVWREPVHGTYHGHDIWSMPGPSSGGILLVEMLNMLEPHNLRELGWGSTAAVHRMIEAQRRAYADRARHLGDPDYYGVPRETLTSKDYARMRFSDFDPERASASEDIAPGNIPPESPETTHFSVIDREGNAVSMTTTLNRSYGNKIVVPGAGFLLNNEMDDFAAKPNAPNSYGLIGLGEANAIEPGKRMLSSMSPTIVARDGRTRLVTGSPGGSTIINTVLQVILNVVDHGMGIEEAVSRARFHHQWMPNIIRYEEGAIPAETVQELREMGHVGLNESRFSMGDANSILVNGNIYEGMSDPREVGGTAGY